MLTFKTAINGRLKLLLIKATSSYMLVLVGCGGLGVDVVESLAMVRRYLVNSPPVGSLHATVILVVVDDTRFGATG